MVNINNVYGSGAGDTLKAEDLPNGAEWLVTISGWDVQPFKQDRKNPLTGVEEKVDVNKVVLALAELEKRLVCNWTITSAIAQFYGDETDDWVGRTLVLYVDPHVKYGNKVVAGLRVRVPPEEQMRSSRAVPPPQSPPRDHVQAAQQASRPSYIVPNHQAPPPRGPTPPPSGLARAPVNGIDDEIPFDGGARHPQPTSVRF